MVMLRHLHNLSNTATPLVLHPGRTTHMSLPIMGIHGNLFMSATFFALQQLCAPATRVATSPTLSTAAAPLHGGLPECNSSSRASHAPASRSIPG